jgi:hypothetical protein
MNVVIVIASGFSKIFAEVRKLNRESSQISIKTGTSDNSIISAFETSMPVVGVSTFLPVRQLCELFDLGCEAH